MSEFRKDPVSGRSVIIAAGRAKRPGHRGAAASAAEAETCPFCAGNEAMTPPEVFADREPSDEPDRSGWRVRVVPNKYPALAADAAPRPTAGELYETLNGIGIHEVIIESPDHLTDLTQLSEAQIVRVLNAYRQRLRHWRSDRRWRYFLLYKNQGEGAGATLEHVHSQFIALPSVPQAVEEQIGRMKRHYERTGRCIYCRLIDEEIEHGERLAARHEDIIVLCPFAPRFAYETWILPTAHAALFEESSEGVTVSLARTLRDILSRLNGALGRPPFNLVLHTAPVDEAEGGYYHWRLEILPQLARAAGFEWGTGMHINPVAPEAAARLLRDAAT